MNNSNNNATSTELSGFTLWFVAAGYLNVLILFPLQTLNAVMRADREMFGVVRLMAFLNALIAPFLADFFLFAFVVTNWSWGNILAACVICLATIGSARINSHLATLTLGMKSPPRATQTGQESGIGQSTTVQQI